jgi:group I intron endonuclease
MCINSIVGPQGNAMIIYKTVNVLNGKFYVGKDERNKPDYYGSGINLNRAIKKYGKENFIKEVLEYCSTKEELIEKEKYWIKETKAQELGYNIADGGWGGNTYDEETRQRISKQFRGRKVKPEIIEKAKRTREEKKKQNPDAYKLSQEHKEILSKTHKGKVHPEEWKKNHSEKMKELYHSGDASQFEKFIENQKGENKRGENNPMWGRKASEETRRKMSISNSRYWLGKKHSPEAIEKRRQKILGTKRSDESKENQRIRMQGENNPFYGETHTPEAKEKIRQSKINKTPEQMLETYIKFHTSRMGYQPSEEQKQKKLQEYIKKKEK